MAEVAVPAAKSALVTGASSGIGVGLARAFARDGYDLVLVARSVAKMETLAEELRKTHGGRVEVIGADLGTARGAERLHAEVKNRGIALAALANNAGRGVFGLFKDTGLSGELTMLQLNMMSLVTLTKLFLPDIIAARGAIMNTASTAAFQPGPYMAVYFATKAFVLSFSEALAAELEDQGVTVTAFCPGPTATGFLDNAAMGDSGFVKGKRLPTADSVAEAGYAAMKRGRRVFVPGAMNWARVEAVRFTPRRMVTGIVKSMAQPH